MSCFKEALEVAKNYGKRCYLISRSGRTEYAVQYIVTGDKLQWTAGLTAGGDVDPAHTLPKDDADGWSVYRDFYDKYSEVLF